MMLWVSFGITLLALGISVTTLTMVIRDNKEIEE